MVGNTQESDVITSKINTSDSSQAQNDKTFLMQKTYETTLFVIKLSKHFYLFSVSFIANVFKNYLFITP